GRGYDQGLIGEIPRRLIAGQVVDVLWRVHQQHVDAPALHLFADPREPRLELRRREGLPTSCHRHRSLLTGIGEDAMDATFAIAGSWDAGRRSKAVCSRWQAPPSRSR